MMQLRSKYRVLFFLIACITLLVSFAEAQTNFSPSAFLRRCLTFEQAGDYELAAQECQSGLGIQQISNEVRLDLELTLARVYVKHGQYSRAEGSLRELSRQINTAEPLLLLAEIAYQSEEWDSARNQLHSAKGRLHTTPNSKLEGERYYLLGKLDERVGDYQAAADSYASAIGADPEEARYHLADANIRFLTGSPETAIQRLEAYLSQIQNANAGSVRPHLADIYSLLGRASWATGQLEKAGTYLGYAASNRLPAQAEMRTTDHFQRGLVFLSRGDNRTANISFQDAFASGDLLAMLLFRILPWIILLVIFIILQLLGESLVASTSTLEVVDGARAWTAQHAYRILLAALVLSLIVAFLYSLLFYKNMLAILTPIQQDNVAAVFFLSFGLSSFIISFFTLQRLGWIPLQNMLSPDPSKAGSNLPIALIVGVGLLVLTVTYLYFAPDGPGTAGFYLGYQLAQPSTVVVTLLASIFLPLAALFFHPFCQKSFSERYHPTIAMFMVACLYGLVMVAPLLLMIIIGIILAFFYHHTHSGLNVFISWAILQIGLFVLFALNHSLRILTI